jgi:DNA gyrase inhibitor GyrI
MEPLNIRIVQLEPLHVIRAHAFGPHPEQLAWEKLIDWAKARGLLEAGQDPAREQRRIFGFNNPNPSAGSPNYGYEFWLTVGPEVEPDAETGIGITDFPGGLYAVARYEEGKGDDIGGLWQKLIAWVENSPYRPARHQWLEEHLIPLNVPQGPLILDLFMPISA